MDEKDKRLYRRCRSLRWQWLFGAWLVNLKILHCHVHVSCAKVQKSARMCSCHVRIYVTRMWQDRKISTNVEIPYFHPLDLRVLINMQQSFQPLYRRFTDSITEQADQIVDDYWQTLYRYAIRLPGVRTTSNSTDFYIIPTPKTLV